MHEQMELEAVTGKAINVRTQLTEVAQDAVVEANRKMLLERSKLGIQKYGTTLAGNKLSRREWLQHALEESLDLSNYLQAEIMRLDAEAAAYKEIK
jgi:hypothetical protein